MQTVFYCRFLISQGWKFVQTSLTPPSLYPAEIPEKHINEYNFGTPRLMNNNNINISKSQMLNILNTPANSFICKY
jgi:hypothetical protein